MDMSEAIVEKIRILPEEKQTEVLNFINSIIAKINDEHEREEGYKFSLESAMKGVAYENEPLYTLQDEKERIYDNRGKYCTI